MFSKTTKAVDSKQTTGSGSRSSAPSIISADLKVVGDLHSDGEIHIEGSVEGDIRTSNLLVGEHASVSGEVVAEVVRVHGAVTGRIKSKSVHLSKTARMSGDILHEELAIEKGAFMEGHCKRLDTSNKGSEAPKTLVPKDEGRSRSGPPANVPAAGSSASNGKGATEKVAAAE